jgi:SAM-dependent methyltransferase
VRFLDKRSEGYSLLSGKGLEIGAFEHPAELPESCDVSYCDRYTMVEAQKLFPEVDCSKLVQPDYFIDVDQDGLQRFPDGVFDFLIFNHVIEHVVNPLRVLEELFRVLCKDGMCVIAAPDKNYTFDRERPLTSFTSLVKTYNGDVVVVSEEAYRDIVTYIHKELIGQEEEVIREHLRNYHARREHLHVWTSQSFRAFLDSAFVFLDINARAIYEVTASMNEFEYFGVWAKQ